MYYINQCDLFDAEGDRPSVWEDITEKSSFHEKDGYVTFSTNVSGKLVVMLLKFHFSSFSILFLFPYFYFKKEKKSFEINKF